MYKKPKTVLECSHPKITNYIYVYTGNQLSDLTKRKGKIKKQFEMQHNFSGIQQLHYYLKLKQSVLLLYYRKKGNLG
jgi:hypothetical protein